MSALCHTLRPLVTRLPLLALAFALSILAGAPARAAEAPAVKTVVVEGNRRVEADAVKNVLSTKPGQPLDPKKLDDDLHAVMKLGFFADVVFEERGDPEHPTLVVRVTERPAVKDHHLLGNNHVGRDELLDVMQTKEGSFLSFLTSAGTYREDAFQRDLQAIQFVYGDQGYIYAKLAKPAVALSPDKRFLYVTLRIEEGEQYRVGQIDFSGELLHDKSELARRVQVKPGELFARSRVAKDLFAIADVYKDDGYAYANVNPETKVDPATRIIDLTYDVQPGKKTYFERIEISGNSKTRDKVIRREMRIYEGELYNQSSLNNSKQRVTALGYFETVNVTTEKGSADDKLVAKVTVKERSTGTFQIGAGFSSYENFILTGQISQNNFFGWGQTLSLQVQYSSIRQLGQIQFVEPYFLDTKWTFAFDLYATEGFYTTFSRKAIGGSVTWGYELNGLAQWWKWAEKLEDMRVFATYTNEF